MDWRRIVAEAQHTRTLQAADAAAHLARLRDELPQLADAVERLSHGGARTFMRTRSPGVEDAGHRTLEAGETLGVWRVMEHVAAGGMGEVYRGTRADGLYEQTVAIKVMHGQLGRERQAAFERERQRLARLEHPGISRIIDGGTTGDGRPFMVMEYVDGRAITDYVAARACDRVARIRLVGELCRAVAHAHARLVLHLDLKATNVLVNAAGEVKLIDFGIASLMEEGERGGAGPLTLATAAPEQLFGEPLSVATDIFALGVLTHQLLTGRLPERTADGSVAIDEKAIGNRDLIAVLAAATALLPEARYASADALREELLAVPAHRPVRARGGGALYRSARFLQRYPLASAFAAGGLLALVFGLVVSLHMAERAAREAERATHLLARERVANQIQYAYTDALQRLSGNDADLERQKQVLVSRWREAHARRRTSPQDAAYVTYAIASHFMQRGDYATTQTIIEAWLEAPYGPEALIPKARILAGVLYANLGRNEAALPLLREAAAHYAGSFDENGEDHVDAVTHLAMLTDDPAERAAAEAVIRAAMRGDNAADYQLYLINQLAAVRGAAGDLAGAVQAQRQGLALLEDDSLMTFDQADNFRLNLAMKELYVTGDIERVEALTRTILTRDRDQRGVSRRTGRALHYAGEAARERGRLEEAEALLREALSTIARFDSGGSYFHLAAAGALAEVLAERGEFDEALALIEEQRQRVAEADAQKLLHLQLTQAFVVARRDGAAAAKAFLRRMEFPAQLDEAGFVLTHRYQRLAAMNAVP